MIKKYLKTRYIESEILHVTVKTLSASGGFALLTP